MPIFPIDNIEPRRKKIRQMGLRSYLARRTFSQKIVDISTFIGGDALFILQDTEEGISVTWNNNLLSGSLLTWGPIGLLQAFSFLFMTPLYSGIKYLMDHDGTSSSFPFIILSVIGILAGIPLALAGGIIYIATELARISLTCILTFLSLPIIGAIHFFGANAKKDFDDFEKKYDAQNMPETAQEVRIQMPNGTYHHAPMRLLDLSDHLIRLNGAENKDLTTPGKIILLLCCPTPPHQHSSIKFYKFNYSAHGREALNAFKKVYPYLFHQTGRLLNQSNTKDARVSDMIYQFWVLLQINRNKQVQLPLEILQLIAAETENDLFTQKDRIAILEQSTVIPRFHANSRGIGIFANTQSSAKIEEVIDEAEFIDKPTATLK